MRYRISSCTGMQNQKNSNKFIGSGHKDTNAKVSLQRFNVPKSLIMILKG